VLNLCILSTKALSSPFRVEISRVELSREEVKDTVKNAVSSLKALGDEIRTSKYDKISSYTFADPQVRNSNALRSKSIS